ncbi:uncharacterized protein AC631_00934 [Debaryomyces fabryi]|uniref:Uncharacterized protein n=1 Tax=Debaryomyces fabryi TaxID=58627 RepID=A0A0V1Q481_9ASCO|nr:uncharacterized protein AC631_00934 [Debaryomyces fabryi]KSA03296.1 hypothetical protein AC631_00934 [Debaryomyces fabryi]CUM45119.1 unnamed protein product [Debaryomyces fabryi]
MSKRSDCQNDEYTYRNKYARISDTNEEHSTQDVRSFTQGPLDATFGQHAAFPLTQSHEITDPITDSVQSYLETVRREAEKDQCIYFANRDSQESTKNENVDENETKNETKSLESNRKDPEVAITIIENQIWKKELIEEFLHLKEAVELYAQSLKLQPSHISENVSEVETYNEIPFDIPQTATAWRQYIMNNHPPPIKFFFIHLNRPTIIKLLIYVTKWLSANSNENLSKWIFLLFLRLDNLLDHIDCSIVRDLAKKAIKIKVNTDPQDINDVSNYTIDMVIVIVGEYYRQRDLLVY